MKSVDQLAREFSDIKSKRVPRMVDWFSKERRWSPLWFRLENGRLYPKGMAVEEAA